MSESKDRAALRRIATIADRDYHDDNDALRVAIDAAKDALAQPDPCAELAEALRRIVSITEDQPDSRCMRVEEIARAALAQVNS